MINSSEVIYTEQNLDSTGNVKGAGVRKVGERVIQDGRGLIITDENINNYNWDDIPAGSLLVNPKTGIVQVKLEGQSNWQPGLIKNDGTICISQDSAVIVERFEIVNPLLDQNTFTYQDITEPGKIVSGKRSVTTDSTKQHIGYTFTLTHGEYMEDRNLLSVSIERNQGTNNESTVICDVVNGSLVEDAFNKFTIVDKTIKSGDHVVARYFRIIRIGNPYPRWFITDRKPDTLPNGIQKAEEGDMWLDYSQTVDQTTSNWLEERSDMLGWENVFSKDAKGNKIIKNLSVEWSNIQHKPTTIKDLGIENDVRNIVNQAIANNIRYDNIHFIKNDGKTPITELGSSSSPAFPRISWNNISNIPAPVKTLETLTSDMVENRFSIREEVVTIEANSMRLIYWPCPMLNRPLAYVIAKDNNPIKINGNGPYAISPSSDIKERLNEAFNDCYVDAREYGIKIGYDEAYNRIRLFNTGNKSIQVHIRGAAEGEIS